MLNEHDSWARNIGPSLFLARTSSDMTQVDLATKAGITQPYLSQIENGNRTPSLETLRKLQSLTEGARHGTNQDQE